MNPTQFESLRAYHENRLISSFYELFERFSFCVPQHVPLRSCHYPALVGWESTESITRPIYVATQHMTVHIQRRGNVTVTQPRLSVLRVTPTLA